MKGKLPIAGNVQLLRSDLDKDLADSVLRLYHLVSCANVIQIHDLNEDHGYSGVT